MNQSEILALVEKTTDNIAGLLGISAPRYEIGESDDGAFVININFEGDKMGYMIGPRGRHLQSLQYVLSLMVNKEISRSEGEENKMKVSLIVDAGGYTAKRVEKIEEIALKKADDARMIGTSIDLEPMSAFERRVVHTALSKFDDIKTESYGEGLDRYVRITLVSDEKLGLGDSQSEENEESEQ